MHKKTHQAIEEYLHEALSPPGQIRSQDESENTDQPVVPVESAQWVFGNLYECISHNKNCKHGRIPFGSSYYCAWPLKAASTGKIKKPPCSE